MDEFYFEQGYITTSYFGYIANADSGSRYLVENYHVIDYFEYRGMLSFIACDFDVVIIGTTKEAEATFFTVFSGSQSAEKTAGFTANIETSFTQTAIGQRDRDIDLFAFSDAAIQAQVNRIRDTNIAATEFFSVSSDVARIRSLDADAEDQFVFVGINERSRDFDLQTQAAFSFVVDIDAFNLVAADLISEFTQIVSIDKLRSFSADLADSFSVNVQETRLRLADLQVQTASTVTCDFIVVRDAHLTAFDNIALGCTPNYQAVSSQNLVSQFSVTPTVGFRKSTNATIRGHFSILTSRYAGSDRPKTISGTFTSTQLINQGTRLTDFSSIPFSDNWFFTIGFQISPSIRYETSDSTRFFYIPLGTRNGINCFLRASYRYRGSEGLTVTAQAVIGGAATVTGTNSTGPLYNNTIPLNWTVSFSFTGGQRLAVYQNGQRYAVNNDVPTNGWTIPNNETVSFGTDFPYTRNSSVHTLYTDYAWFATGNYSESGSANLNLPYPLVNTEDTVFLYLFNGNGQETLNLTLSGNATINSQASLSNSISGTFGFRSNLNSQSTLTATVGTLEDINLVAFSDAALTGNVSVITDTVVASNIETNQTTVNSRVRYQSSDISSESTVNAVSLKIHPGQALIETQSAVVTDAVKITESLSTISSEFTVTAVIGTIEDILLTAFTDGSVTTLVDKITGYNSNISSEASLNHSIEIIRDYSSALSATVTQSVSAERSRDNQATIESAVSSIVDGQRLRFVSANVSAAHFVEQRYFETEQGLYIEEGYFTEAKITAVKTAQGSAQFASEFNQITNIGGQFFIALTATSAASVVATAVKQTEVFVPQGTNFQLVTSVLITRTVVSNIVSEFAVFCNGVTSSEVNMVAFSNALVVATPEANKPFSSTLSSVVTVYADTFDSLNSRGSADLSSESVFVVQAVKTAGAVVNTDSIASSLTVAVKDTVSDVFCEFAFTTSAVVEKTTSNIINANTVSSVNADPIKTVDVASDHIATVTVNAAGVVVVAAEIITQSIASSLSVVARTAAFFINADLNAQVQITGVVIRSADVHCQADNSLTADPFRVRFNSSTITALTNLSALIGVIKPFDAVIASAMTFVANVRELRLEEIEYRIPAEGWIYVITGEDREYDIIGETGLRLITGETRIKRIDGETRVYIVE